MTGEGRLGFKAAVGFIRRCPPVNSFSKRRTNMKGMRRMISMLLAVVLVCSLAGGALADDEYDTLADWGIRVFVPDGTTSVYDGSDDCYYIYTTEDEGIPYVMLTTFTGFDSEKEFIEEFTDYMETEYTDLKVTSETSQKKIGDRKCFEIDYGYTISGCDVHDRRVVFLEDGTTYMFCSKEVEELDLTVGIMLEEIVAMSELIDGEEEEIADAYLYCQEDGMPKYWLDITGALADDPVLHCYFRSSDPTFYESWFVLDLDSAEEDDDGVLHFTGIKDQYGFDHSDWFKSLTIELLGDRVILGVTRDESTLAGGEEDNILSGVYKMLPMDVDFYYDYRQDDGMLKYWLDLNGEDIVLHCMFRSEGPDFYESTFTLAMDDAEWVTDYTILVNTVYDSMGLDVSDWFESLILSEVEGAILMNVERDESTLAGGTENNILTGVYMCEPRPYLISPDDGPFTAEELGVLAQRHYFFENGFFPPRADVEENDDGTFGIHLFETVRDGGFPHTATSAWYTVDEMGLGEEDTSGRAVDITR